MIEFLRDPDTGALYAYDNGELIGPVITMGDGDVPLEPSVDLWEKEHGNG